MKVGDFVYCGKAYAGILYKLGTEKSGYMPGHFMTFSIKNDKSTPFDWRLTTYGIKAYLLKQLKVKI